MSEDKDLFRRTFSHLEVSPALREELSAMTEKMEQTRKPKRFILRKLVVTVVIMALAVILAMGANAATGGELYEATIGKLVYITLDNGIKGEIYQDKEGGFAIAINEQPNDVDSETAENDGYVNYEKSFEIEVDDGHITMNENASSVLTE